MTKILESKRFYRIKVFLVFNYVATIETVNYLLIEVLLTQTVVFSVHYVQSIERSNGLCINKAGEACELVLRWARKLKANITKNRFDGRISRKMILTD